jgi:hypothetical protein
MPWHADLFCHADLKTPLLLCHHQSPRCQNPVPTKYNPVIGANPQERRGLRLPKLKWISTSKGWTAFYPGLLIRGRVSLSHKKDGRGGRPPFSC